MTDLALEHDELRPLMFSIAYRMLGSVSEAEDVVQDAFLRIHRSITDGTALDNPEAYATTVTTRVAIDTLRSARARRESYVGPWLPEPILDDDADPAHRIELGETVTAAFLVVLEKLSPVERAVFLLREVFAYDYAEIAAIVDKSEANCRQLLVRAKRHLEAEQPQLAPAERQDELANAFFAAIERGELESLEQLLAEDATFYGDGGGKAPAVRVPVTGSGAVARFLFGLLRQGKRLDVRLDRTRANGQPAMILRTGDDLVLGVLTLDIGDDAVTALRNQINPDKLQHLGEVGDMIALLSQPR
ncbi:RNA polymerase sigma-70 factor [Solicola gregarius]|uniref:RNA polymerase sigma-70 factor n=1 Tax=Solicola gregarius TaxID=2908642 RepID=A0AA46TEP0_9ACTN|nr:RNA polymerase sigma-70 factor [Solicola gregarius]UYM03850.1 RNA polymerase sigma-70 factor [Solicola gregarius]